jgi:hypothetical protein
MKPLTLSLGFSSLCHRSLHCLGARSELACGQPQRAHRYVETRFRRVGAAGWGRKPGLDGTETNRTPHLRHDRSHAVQIMRDPRLSFESGRDRPGTPEEFKAAYDGYYAYVGT